MKMLSKDQMKEIMKNKTIDKQNEQHQKQIMEFAFGKEFMESENKGERVVYEISKEEFLERENYYVGYIFFESELKNKKLSYKVVDAEDMEYYFDDNSIVDNLALIQMVKFAHNGKEIICAEYQTNARYFKVVAIV